MIDKGLYRKNFYVGGGADMGGVADSKGNVGPGPGGGDNNKGRDLDFQQRGRPKDYTKTKGGDIFATNDPTAIEKMDFFGPTVFGPGQKFTGSFLDNLLGLGYRNVTPSGRQFQSRFNQMGGIGKGILGGILGLINPFAGLAYKGISSLGALKDYDTLADFAKGELGLFKEEDEDENDTIDIRDKFNRMGIMNPNLITPQPKPGINLNDYIGLENAFSVPSSNPEKYDFFSNAMAEITDKDIEIMKTPTGKMMDYDTFKAISGNESLTPQEFEQLKSQVS